MVWRWGLLVAALLLPGKALSQDGTVFDFRGLGPAPLEDPEALHLWGNKARHTEGYGCATSISAWERVVELAPLSDWAPPSLYNMAVCYEFSQEYEQSLALYDRILDDYPGDPLAKDATFRKGLVYEQMGAPAKARRIFRQAMHNRALRLTQADYDAAAIQRDIALLHMGRTRRGVRRLLEHIEAYEALDRESQGPRLYWIAKANVGLGRVLSAHAADIPMTLTPWHRIAAIAPWNSDSELLGRQLDERGADLMAARGRYNLAVDTRVKEWTLAAIYFMARDYEVLYRDLVAAPPPKELDDVAAEEWRHALIDKSYPALVKAYRLYVQGEELARSYDIPTPYGPMLAEKARQLDLEGVAEDGIFELDLRRD